MEQVEERAAPRSAAALLCLVVGFVVLQFGTLVSNVIAYSTGGPGQRELLVAPDPLSDAVSATAAEFRVDESGAATYSIPLYAVPGTAGVAPKLSLNYSSQAGEGPVGKGWSIGGLSAISRCRATREAGDFLGAATPDGNPAPINFSASDRFCLDGQRLLPSAETCPSVGGMSGTALATEVETFQRVCAYAGAQGPAFFTVERKDGSKSCYGDRDDGQGSMRPDGAVRSTSPGFENAILSWLQVRFQDSTGNYIDYRYSQGGEDNLGENLIDAVRYTGKVGSALLPYAEIKFNYEFFLDRLVYVSGGKTRSRYRLASITSSVDHDHNGTYNDVRHYGLSYGFGLMTTTLASVRECSDRTQQICAQPTTFEWSSPSTEVRNSPFETHEQTGSIPNGSLSKFEGFKFADVDGDGRQDFVWMKDGSSGEQCPTEYVYVAYSRFHADGTMRLSVGGPVMCTPDELANSPKDQSWFLLDYNGDGREDIFFRTNAGWVGYASTGGHDAPFATNTNLLAELAQPIPAGTNREQEPQQADLNGDGLIDLVYPRNGALIARIMERGGSYGFRWGHERTITLTGECGTDCYLVGGLYRKNNYLQLNDFNGDARSDLLVTISKPNGCGGGGGGDPPGPPGPPIIIQSNTETVACPVAAPFVVESIDAASVTLREYGTGYFPTTSRTTFADVNGDGLTDPIYHGDGTPYPGHALNTGAGFSGQDIPSGGSQSPVNTANLQIADINNDGRADMLYPAGSNYSFFHVRYGLASGAFSAPIQLDQALTGCLDNTCASRTHIFADLDGDGNTDYMRIRWDNDSSSPVLFSRAAPERRHMPRNVITRITNGLGAITQIKYGSLNNGFLYSPDAGSRNALSWGRGSPVQDLHAPMHVVSRASSSSPIAGDPNAMATVHYRYTGAKVQAGGRGFLGFREIQTIDPNQSNGFVVTTTSYSQNFPFIGMPWKTVKKAAPATAYTPHACLESVTLDGCFVISGTGLPAVAGEEFSRKEQVWQANPANLNVQAAMHVRISGTEETLRDPFHALQTSKVATSFTYGSHGNVTETIVDTYTGTDDDPTATLITAHGYSDNVDRWHLGRLTSTTVTHRRPEQPDVVRTSGFSYDSGAVIGGLLTEERVQPGGGAAQALTTRHGLDDFGNRVLTTTCAAPATNCDPNGLAFQPLSATEIKRYSRVEYDARGRFPVATYEPFWNGAGGEERRTSRVIARNLFGDAVHAADVNNVNTLAVKGALGRDYYTWTQTHPGATPGQGGASSLTTYRWCTQVNCPAGASFRQQTAALGAPRQWSYFDVLGRPILQASETFNVGVGGEDVTAVCTQYDLVGRPKRVSNPFFLPGVADHTGPAGVTGACAAAERKWTVTTFDVLGRPTRVDAPDTSAVTTAYEGQWTTVTDQRLKQSSQIRNGKGELVVAVDAAGMSTYFGYDAAGNLRRIERDAGAGIVANAFVHDALGRKVEQSDPDTGTTRFEYNALGELIAQIDAENNRTEQARDARGRVWRKTVKRADGVIESEATFTFDTAPNGVGQVHATTITGQYGAWAGQAGLGLAYTRRVQYDILGRPNATQTETEGQVFPEYIEYDALGRPWKTQDASLSWTKTEFGPRGHAVALCASDMGDASPACAPGAWQRTLAINAAGQVIKERRGDSTAMEVLREYNANTGRLQWICAGNTACNLTDENYLWDAAGNLDWHLKEGRYLEKFQYDALNRLQSATLEMRDGVLVSQNTLSHGYDALGNVCSKNGIGYGYGAGHGCAPLAAQVAPEPMQSAAAQAVPAATRTARSSARTHLPAQAWWQRGVQFAPEARYRRYADEDRFDWEDDAERFDWEDELDGGATTLGRSPTGAWAASRRAAARAAPQSVGTPGTTWSSVATAASSPSTNSVVQSRPHAVTQTGSGAAATAYYYDTRGNQTLRDAPGTANDRTIRYSLDDKPHEIAMGNGTRVRFWYGPDGQRYRKEVGGVVKLYLGNVEVLIEGGVTTFRRYVGGVVMQTLSSGVAPTTQYLFHDQLGSLVRVANPDGSVAEGLDYAAFGQRRSYSDPHAAGITPTTTPRGYTGHEMLDGTGVIHMNGRIYDAELGRFLQADPLIQAPDNAQSWNAYTYVFNNPLRYTDPTGMLGQEERGWLATAIFIVGMIVAPQFTGPYAAAYAAGYAAAVGFVSGAVATKSWQGAIMGAFTAAIGQGLSGAGGFEGWIVKTFSGGVMGSLQGGNFGHAFVSAGLTAGFAPLVGRISNDAARIAVNALVGGTISEATGGKFANGAITGAIQAAMAGGTRREGAALEGEGSSAPLSRKEAIATMKKGISIFRKMRADGVMDGMDLYDDIDAVNAAHPGAYKFHYSGERMFTSQGEVYAEADIFGYSGIEVRRIDSLDSFMETTFHEVAHFDVRLDRLWRQSTPGYGGRIESYPDLRLQQQIHTEIDSSVNKLMEVYRAKYKP